MTASDQQRKRSSRSDYHPLFEAGAAGFVALLTAASAGWGLTGHGVAAA
jgi:hypothetical protein